MYCSERVYTYRKYTNTHEYTTQLAWQIHRFLFVAGETTNPTKSLRTVRTCTGIQPLRALIFCSRFLVLSLSMACGGRTQADDVDLEDARCVGDADCKRKRSFNFRGQHPMFCAKHKAQVRKILHEAWHKVRQLLYFIWLLVVLCSLTVFF